MLLAHLPSLRQVRLTSWKPLYCSQLGQSQQFLFPYGTTVSWLQNQQFTLTCVGFFLPSEVQVLSAYVRLPASSAKCYQISWIWKITAARFLYKWSTSSISTTNKSFSAPGLFLSLGSDHYWVRDQFTTGDTGAQIPLLTSSLSPCILRQEKQESDN